MAAEPEKKIEELLRSYSRKRREDAGAPTEMHPATRRMLQGEAAKLAKAGQAQPRSRWQSFFLMWPRFAATVGMFAVIAVGVWVITQTEEKPTTQLAAEQRLDESLSRAEGVVDAKKDALADNMDALAVLKVEREETARKDVDAAKRRTEEFTYNEGKAQIRDLERLPADRSGAAPMPAPAAPQPVKLAESLQEKDISLRYDSPAKQAAGVAENKLATSADKQNELAQSLAGRPEVQVGQTFRQSAAEPMRENEARTKAPVGELAAAAISGARFVGNATNTNLYALSDQISATNAASRSYFAKQVTNLLPAQALNDFAVAYSLQPPAASPAPATQGSVPASELAKNERARGAAPVEFAGVEVVAVKDEFERIDPNATLLRTFEVQKSGDRIQIRDADGSVYDGTIVQRVEVGAKVKETAERPTLQRTADTRFADADDQALSFRASGTNKSLRQLVIINGQFFDQAALGLDAAGKVVTTAGASAAPALTAPTSQTRLQPAPARSAQPLPTNRALAEREALGRGFTVSNETQTFKASAIRARVLVGTNEVNVNAVRRRSDR